MKQVYGWPLKVSIEPKDVRFGSKADIASIKRDVRFSPKSGHSAIGKACPLSAIAERD
jgi:hypothetical protein